MPRIALALNERLAQGNELLAPFYCHHDRDAPWCSCLSASSTAVRSVLKRGAVTQFSIAIEICAGHRGRRREHHNLSHAFGSVSQLGGVLLDEVAHNFRNLRSAHQP